MSKQLVNYVHTYVAPMSKETHDQFIQKLEKIMTVCVNHLLSIYNSFISQKMEPALAIETALKQVFTTEFLLDGAEYKAQFINVDYAIVQYVLDFSKKHRELYVDIASLTHRFSQVIEYLLIQLAELYFLCNCDEAQLWNELYKDAQLSHIIKKLKLKEKVMFDCSRPFLNDYQIEHTAEKEAHAFIDSYIVALTRSKFY